MNQEYFRPHEDRHLLHFGLVTSLFPKVAKGNCSGSQDIFAGKTEQEVKVS